MRTPFHSRTADRGVLRAVAAVFAFLLVAMLGFPRGPLAGTPTPPSSTPRFEENSQVVSVEVPVEVVDGDGHPVRGLKETDFEVFDEGKKQPLTHFETVDLENMKAEPGQLMAGEQLSASARRHFLLLFDLSYARPNSIQRARAAARDFILRSLRPTDLVGVATYSLQTGPRLVITFTPDRGQVVRAIQTLGMDKNNESGKKDPLQFVLEPPPDNGSSVGGAAKAPDAKVSLNQIAKEESAVMRFEVDRADKTFSRTQVTSFLRSLGDLAKILDAVRGRKHVILFSEGFDNRLLFGHGTTGRDAFVDNDNIEHGDISYVDTDNLYGNTPLQQLMDRMLREFMRSDCVIDAVDIGGLRSGGDASDEQRPGGDESLFVLADGTGGTLFKDGNDLRDQIERVFGRTTVTYLLTFQRDDLKADGAFRRLKVKAKLPPGAKIAYRTGYYAPRPFQQLDPLERNLLAADSIASAAVRLDLDFNVLVSPFRANADSAYVPVVVEVAGAPLLADHKNDKLNVEFYTYVSNAQGEMKDFLTQRVSLNIRQGRDAILASGLKYYGHLNLVPGDYRLRILVRDTDTGRTGVRMIPLRVPTYALTEPFLLTPFFIDKSETQWVMVREKGAPSPEGDVVYPFTLKGEPYIPSALPTLGSQSSSRLCLVGYNLGSGNLQVRSHVTTPDGQLLQGGSLAVVERTSTGIHGLDKLIAEFKPTGLTQGSYVLQIAIKDPGTGREGVNSVPFQVVR
jgi:VWFA-related protein